MSSTWKPPQFSTTDWYADPGDPRCPRDAELETVEVREMAKSGRSSKRRAAITLKLLGADRGGSIVLTYFGVHEHALTSYQCDQGGGEWLRDEFSESENGLTAHRITWCSGAAGVSQWLIEAEEVRHQWQPTNERRKTARSEPTNSLGKHASQKLSPRS